MSVRKQLINAGLAALAFTCAIAPATAQAPDDDGGPVIRDSGVGYIDSAVPTSQLRLRFDSAWRNNRPTRAEFFYPKGGAAGPGLPTPDPRIDYQDLSAYLEIAYQGRFSVFVESPYRFLNPTRNDNTSGFSDLNAGFKWAFWETDASLLTAQLRGYFPTGDSERGLGTHHASLEPGLLFQHRFSENLLLEGEARYWVALGGTNFAGEAVRYGLGLTWGQRSPDAWWATPVTEVVGWTFLSGQELVFTGTTTTAIQDAHGDTIVNAKVGLRFGRGEHWDLYAGYGRALTGEVLYKDTVRFELRWKF